MTNSMIDILELVKSGRLQDATDEIQRGLGAGAATAERDEAEPARPMKDVTPQVRALPSPTEKAAPRARRAPDMPKGRGAMTRHEDALPYRLFTPLAPRADAPLVVMLHGCTQSPEDFARGTRMNAFAGATGAHVVWPEQRRSANTNGCWNWFDPAHQGRSGEAEAIAQIIRDLRARVAPGASGVHVAGLSAGGAMAAILGAHYPDIVSSVGIHSGLPVGSARDVGSAFAAMRSGGTAMSRIAVPSIVFHGTADRTVASANGVTLARSGLDGTKPRRRVVEIGDRRATVTRALDENGRPVGETWEIDGLAHAWSGGDAGGSYADPKGPDATAEMLRFFAEVDGLSS